MKGERKQYEPVKQLPENAIKVRTYADNIGKTVAYIYKMQSLGKVRIVTFAGINFVIPELINS